MSRVQDEKQYNTPKKGSSKGTSTQTNFYVFRPTKGQREEMTKQWTDLEKNLLKVTDFLEHGCKLNLGYAPKTNSMFASLRGPAPNWEEAPTVTVYHMDPARLIAMLAYVCTEIAPEFPRNLPAYHSPEELEW